MSLPPSGPRVRQGAARLAALAAAVGLLASAARAQVATPRPPTLLVVVSVDQLSADLFAQYRQTFTGGFARLMQGAVFPSGYQSHAGTETCPGHSTITTGARPARTGIIANDWYNLRSPRPDKKIYCSEDDTVPGSSSTDYTVSDRLLLVPTLGERMKAANHASRVVSVAGKDRSAVMMGGHDVDALWWWDGKHYRSYAGRSSPRAVTDANNRVASMLASSRGPQEMPALCRPRARAVSIGGGRSVGTGRFEHAAGDALSFRASPDFDQATLTLAAALIRDMKLGQSRAPDIITVGASATDYVGHTFGPGGAEMCMQLLALDYALGDFFKAVDATGVEYVVALTADHGGLDLPERAGENGAPGARLDPLLTAENVGAAVAAKLGLTGHVLRGGSLGDFWIDPSLTPSQRSAVQAEAAKIFRAHPQVEAVFTAEEIRAKPAPAAPPDSWSLLERAKASYNPERSGDLVVALKPRITPITVPGRPFVSGHGSFWDYDRRVPILFWRRGMVPFEQPLAVETVDIAPTLAALIGVSIPRDEIDGRCLDLIAGPASSCAGAPIASAHDD